MDKSAWIDGPWKTEPDRVEFRHGGFPCIIKRNYGGAWCGYVGVAPGHPWHGKHYNDVEAEVHGGLTYSNECHGEICHVPEPGEPEHLWWLGFDCAHGFDLSPGRQHRYPIELRDGSDVMYRDQAYVTAETMSLSEQAAKATLVAV